MMSNPQQSAPWCDACLGSPDEEPRPCDSPDICGSARAAHWRSLQQANQASVVLLTPSSRHRHGEGLGSGYSTGTVARCGCGLWIIYGGSTTGMVGWHRASWRERRRINRRLR